MDEVNIDTLTLEQYLVLSGGNQASSVVRHAIANNVNFEIKSQFIRELRKNTFLGNKNDDAHEHVERVLDIASLFNTPGVNHVAVMLHVFPITLTGAAKRWFNKIPSGTINTLDLLKNAFIQRYCLPSKTTKQFKEIHNFKQEGDEMLYQAWERYNNLLYKPELWSQFKHWRITYKNDMMGLEGQVVVVQMGLLVGCGIFEGSHLDKDFPINEEVKGVEEVKYGEVGRTSPNNNGSRYRIGPPGYYTHFENQPPFKERRTSLE
ncbi:hypothetical protein Tco_0792054 [Tanacetum coccineum]